MSMIVFLVILLLLIGGGGWGFSRYGAAGGIGPLGLAVLVLAVLYFTGNMHF